MSFEELVRIPEDRIGVLIGKSGKIKSKIEKTCSVKLEIDSENGEVKVFSDIVDEKFQTFKALEIIAAIGRGFSPEKAVRLLKGENTLHVINLREFGAKSSEQMERLKGRIIGNGGKARVNMENLSNADITVYGKTVSVIGEPVYGGLTKVFAGIIIAPIGGIVFGMVLVGIIIAVFAKRRPAVVNRTFGRLSIISSAWLALTHGANDGQKTMGIIVLILFSADLISEIHMPLWVILAAASAMGLGTFFGGYKVIKTLGLKITRLKPYQGFAAQTGGGVMLAIFALLGIPASTTHAITGSVMGAGAARRIRAVRWKVSRQIILSWVITIPGAAGLAIAFTYIIH